MAVVFPNVGYWILTADHDWKIIMPEFAKGGHLIKENQVKYGNSQEHVCTFVGISIFVVSMPAIVGSELRLL